MLTLGLAGGLDPVHEEFLDAPENYTYDGAAVLVEDGRVVAAIEEERLNRIKHSNKFPVQAIKFCLEHRGVRPQDIDRIAYYVHEAESNALLSRLYLARPDIDQRVDARTLFALTLGRELKCEIDPSRLCFFQHKLTHAVCTMAQSGFDESLVFVIDNAGGLFLGRRENGAGLSLESIAAMPPSRSLGRFCQAVLPFLGFGLFEEYKAVALAPYGDAEVYRALFSKLYELLPNGDYRLHLDRIGLLIEQIEPRRRQQQFSQAHKDLAASLQQAIEEIVFHVLQYYRQTTDQHNLCMAGGMVENSTTNGRILSSGLFNQVFVHPVSYDSGCAIGAALLASYEGGSEMKRERVRHVYWGTEIGEGRAIAAELERWQGFLCFERSPNVARQTAELIARGAVVGWVQGRSEFGSHALGNRSIVGDPRPEENRARLNVLLGRHESYRPFAPTVLAGDAPELFDLPADTDAFAFTTFVVKVREDKRRVLGATIHADGTARLQTLARETNPRYWELIKAFKDITGVPALLHTSFNNRIEPAVDSVHDAVVSFLTTGLDYLVVGEFVVHKATPTWEDWLSLRVSLPAYVKLIRSKGLVERTQRATRDEIRTSYDSQLRRRISAELSDVLIGLNAEKPLRELLQQSGGEAERQQALLAELQELWSERLVVLRACSGQGNVA